MKIIERLNEHNFFPTLQSAYRRFHSTETSVLKLVCDVLLAADRGEVTLLGFLDLPAAFDTVDHKILLDRLRVTFGLRCCVCKCCGSINKAVSRVNILI